MVANGSTLIVVFCSPAWGTVEKVSSLNSLGKTPLERKAYWLVLV